MQTTCVPIMVAYFNLVAVPFFNVDEPILDLDTEEDTTFILHILTSLMSSVRDAPETCGGRGGKQLKKTRFVISKLIELVN